MSVPADPVGSPFSGAVDYWCNAFTPDRVPVWQRAIANQGLSLKVERVGDEFCTADAMAARLDAAGFATAILTVAGSHANAVVAEPIAERVSGGHRPDNFDQVACRAGEMAELAQRYPGRFVGMWSVDPTMGPAATDSAAPRASSTGKPAASRSASGASVADVSESGASRSASGASVADEAVVSVSADESGVYGSAVDEAAEMLAQPWCVALHNHTHSWDRPFDHPDFEPFYRLCAEHDVPMVVQAGASGGRFPHECGRPEPIAGPAARFPSVRFVLSHTGWPWTAETIAVVERFPNVFLGTATWPRRRWSDELRDFISGVGAGQTMFGSGFPTTGHAQAARQFADPALALSAKALDQLMGGTARRVFTRLPEPGLRAVHRADGRQLDAERVSGGPDGVAGAVDAGMSSSAVEGNEAVEER